MKPIHLLKIGLLALSAWLPTITFAQFTTMENVPVEICDCRTMMNNLNVTVDIPEEVYNFDIIGFQLIHDGNSLGTVSYYTDYLAKSKTMTFNILKPNDQLGQMGFGMESALFQGDNFGSASYSSICYGKEASNLYLIVYGLKEAGTQTTYQYLNNGTILGRTEKLYGNATTITVTNKLPVIPLGIHPKSRLATVATTGFLVVGAGVAYFLKTTLAKVGL